MTIRIAWLAALLVIGPSWAAAAYGQTRDCRSPIARSVGVAVGKSLPYVELSTGAVDPDVGGSISVKSGAEFAGRADLPVTGLLRVRFEAGAARWDVRRTLYDPVAGFQIISDTSIGRMTMGHVVGLVGLRMGRAPACAHVSIGGGFYSIAFRDTTQRRPGGALAAGIDIPAGSRGSIQLDATLHFVQTRDAEPIDMTTVPALSLLVGWAHRF